MAMGLLKEGINEVIGTTTLNAAPMGVIYRNGRYSMVAYLGSHTSENLANQGYMVANILHDPVIYVTTAFDDLPEEAFTSETVDGLTVHRLACAEAWVAMKATIERQTPDALIIALEPVRQEIVRHVVHPVNRGFCSIIEATVHATRYIRTGDPALRDLIGHHISLAKKCGGKRELEAIEILSGYVEKYSGSE
jgi:hypothetical protein